MNRGSICGLKFFQSLPILELGRDAFAEDEPPRH
jgi:hypothetical protein